MFPTIEISSTLSSDNDSRSCVFFWSDSGGTLSPVSLGIDKAVWIVVPFMFIAATPVGAINRTVGSSGFTGASLKVFAAV